ncbi:MAG: Lrp/AsnC family transcriptional regulator [Rhodospirillaceae bacterium]|nr:MAG: Lrp/AsnC family transcriptional regulator [Rhodospirillaceae bacterium]
MELDDQDIRILAALQADGRLTNNDLAERVGLSPSPCWRRVKRLEEEGIIRGYQAMFDQRRLGLGVTVFVNVSIHSQDTKAHQAFEKAVINLPEVVGCHILAGQHDFLLQVVAEDLDAYGEFALQVLGKLPGVREIHSSFALKEVKPPLQLPLRRRGEKRERSQPAKRSRRDAGR